MTRKTSAFADLAAASVDATNDRIPIRDVSATTGANSGVGGTMKGLAPSGLATVLGLGDAVGLDAEGDGTHLATINTGGTAGDFLKLGAGGKLEGVTASAATTTGTGSTFVLGTNPVISYGTNAQTGTTYTLALTDGNGVVTVSNASAQTVTIPTNAAVAFPIGTLIRIIMLGAGVTTVDGNTGVTVNGVSGGGAAISAQYTGVTLLKIATDTWIMEGNHGTVA